MIVSEILTNVKSAISVQADKTQDTETANISVISSDRRTITVDAFPAQLASWFEYGVAEFADGEARLIESVNLDANTVTLNRAIRAGYTPTSVTLSAGPLADCTVYIGDGQYRDKTIRIRLDTMATTAYNRGRVNSSSLEVVGGTINFRYAVNPVAKTQVDSNQLFDAIYLIDQIKYVLQGEFTTNLLPIEFPQTSLQVYEEVDRQTRQEIHMAEIGFEASLPY